MNARPTYPPQMWHGELMVNRPEMSKLSPISEMSKLSPIFPQRFATILPAQ